MHEFAPYLTGFLLGLLAPTWLFAQRLTRVETKIESMAETLKHLVGDGGN